jgi:integrase
MLELKNQDGLNPAYLRHLRYDLDKFALTFNCYLRDITGEQIDKWLRGLGVAARTRNNLRTSLQTLFSFAKSKKYLPKDHDEMESVGLAKVRSQDIQIYSPNELRNLLSHALPNDIPFLVLGAFAGIRHAEIQRLTWDEIDFDSKLIEIRADKAKTASRRMIPMSPNLESWLSHVKGRSGKVCNQKNISDSMTKLTARIQKSTTPSFQWKRNALRHSFISYRIAIIQDVAKVALEAGNSPQVIFSNYRELVTAKQAREWFEIFPSPPGKSSQSKTNNRSQ